MVSYDVVVSAILLLGSFGWVSNIYIYHTAYRRGRMDARREFALRLKRLRWHADEVVHDRLQAEVHSHTG